jgi:D-alanine-D-alanine ligase
MKAMKKVAVLMGGWSSEREVSLLSAKGIVDSLRRQHYDVKVIDVTRDIPKLLQELTYGPDVVCMAALHGRWVEDGCLQGLLEMMGLAYTHSGVRASANAMYKPTSRRLLEQAGVSLPKGVLIKRADIASYTGSFPCVIKPLSEGSSQGVEIALTKEDLLACTAVWQYGEEALIEEYIPGRELHVAVAFGKAIGTVEILPHEGFYDYKAKYTDGQATHLMPAPVAPDVYAQSLSLAEEAYHALECEGVARIDMRYNEAEAGPKGLFVLEVNTQPGMTPLSLVPEIAAYTGISFDELVKWMVENPRCPELMQLPNAALSPESKEQTYQPPGASGCH